MPVKKIVKTVEIKLRLADKHDISLDKKNLRVGQPFWLLSLKTNKFDNGCQIINNDMDVDELGRWLRCGQIYVPITWTEDYGL